MTSPLCFPSVHRLQILSRQSTVFHGILHVAVLRHDAIAPPSRITNPNSRSVGLCSDFEIRREQIADITGNRTVSIQNGSSTRRGLIRSALLSQLSLLFSRRAHPPTPHRFRPPSPHATPVIYPLRKGKTSVWRCPSR